MEKTMANDKPNFIVFMTDDQGYGDVGFNGCTDIPTPNIDRIAYEGVKLIIHNCSLLKVLFDPWYRILFDTSLYQTRLVVDRDKPRNLIFWT